MQLGTNNPFANARTVTKSTKSKKAEAPESPVKGLLEYAQISAVFQAIEGLKKTAEQSVKSVMSEMFKELGTRLGSRPSNFKGKDGVGKASCELRKRGANSPLKPEEIELANERGIELEVVKPELFYINPEHIDTPEKKAALFKIMGDALKKVALPTDLIVHEPAKYSVSEKGIDQMFDPKQATFLDVLLPLGTTLGIKPVLTEMNFDDSYEAVKKMVAANHTDE